MRLVAGMIFTLSSAPAVAQQQPDAAPSIQVVGTATVSTSPDGANLVYRVAGEGRTADEASAALAAKHKAITQGLAGLLGADTQASAGEVIVVEARAPECDGPNNSRNRPRLSTGACAVTGYVARLQGNVRTGAVDKAGTAAGLAARLGASDARLQGFFLADPQAAQRRATAAAIADARAKAEAMAAGAGVRLGPLITLNDQNAGGEIVVSGASMETPQMMGDPLPPVAIDITPRPIETRARVHARFAITPR